MFVASLKTNLTKVTGSSLLKKSVANQRKEGLLSQFDEYSRFALFIMNSVDYPLGFSPTKLTSL
ncbi:hypothetical protein KSF_008090 [Reticulibacter mediterranei]|uniref:Uncharacterized protein n=1 Tax=Reticulibacter mediterranei TaxID=2778369 RepID=A0A8J3IA90_9CHLR|nr:hypothetical protein [Reticulibacter mediterranei]GHO90761.1 hypothetical protein KSF_008090 [Reticulibacter mediterranei]